MTLRKIKPWRAPFVAATATVAALALTACGGGTTVSDSSSGSDGSGGEKVITAAVGYDTENYDPGTTTSALALAANWHTMEGLTELDPVTREVYPALGKELPKKVNDTTYEVTLRDDAKFSTGDPVTADDVVAAFTRTMEGFYAPFLTFIDSVVKKDDTTVTITTKYPFSLINERLSLVKIVPASLDEATLKSAPIGTGPYTMTEAIKSDHVSFKKNEFYNGSRKAGADAMNWRILVDDTARVTAMNEGSVLAMENVPSISEEQLKAHAKVESRQGFNQPFIMFNTKKAPFDNPKVRQAVLYGIDAQELIDKTLGGHGTPATSFLPKEHPNYHEAANVYTYNPDKAKELLKEAGVSDLHLTLNTTDHPWIKNMAPLVQQQLKEAGITVDAIDSQASGAMYNNVTDVDNPTFDVVMAPGDPSVFGQDPDLLMNWWYGDNPWTQKRSGWKDSSGYAALHVFMDDAVRSTGSEQQDNWNAAFDVISEEVPIYPLFHRSVTAAWNDDKLDGFKPVALTGISFLDVKVK